MKFIWLFIFISLCRFIHITFVIHITFDYMCTPPPAPIFLIFLTFCVRFPLPIYLPHNSLAGVIHFVHTSVEPPSCCVHITFCEASVC